MVGSGEYDGITNINISNSGYTEDDYNYIGFDYTYQDTVTGFTKANKLTVYFIGNYYITFHLTNMKNTVPEHYYTSSSGIPYYTDGELEWKYSEFKTNITTGFDNYSSFTSYFENTLNFHYGGQKVVFSTTW